MNKICFIGAGNMAQMHIDAFSKIKYIYCSGIYSRTFSKSLKIASKYQNLNAYKNLDKMMQKEKPNGIIIAVSENSLLNLLKKIIKYKLPTLIEKPIGCNFNQNLKIIKILKKKKIKNFYVALNRRQYSSTLKLQKKISKDNSLRKIYINDQQFNMQKKLPHKDKLVVKNMMYANSVHLIDYINIFARGKIDLIKSYLEKKKNIKKLLSIISFSSGDIVYYNAIWNEYSKWGVRIFTNNYFYEMSPLEELNFFNLKNLKNFKIKKDYNDIKFKPGFMKQAINFSKLINNKPHNLVNVYENFETTKLIRKIYENF